VRDQKTSIKVASSLRVPGDIWPYLAVRTFTDWDLWTQHENAVLKTLLDREFPLPDYSLESMLKGVISLGDAAKVQDVANLSVLNHIRRLLDNEAKKWCCMALAARPSPLDYLDLIESLGTDNLMRRAKFFTETQGSPQTALEFLSRIESAYKDHPQHALARAAAESEMAKRVEGAGREGRMRSAYASAFNAFYWEQGQTPTAADAFNLQARLGRSDYGYSDNPFAYDYPYRPYYPTWAAGDSLVNAWAALASSTSNFGPVELLTHLLGNVSKQWNKVDELIQSIEGRFSGHPRRAVLMANQSLRAGDVQSAQRHFRAGIQAQPGYWQSYVDLGKVFLEEGNVAEAARLFMGYPGFKKGSTEHPVSLSNNAYNAGSLFYWTGHFAQAVPLYRIAAELRTGSDASLASEIRLRLMERDIAGAAADSLQRAQRYNSSFAYRDYLGLLHATGQSKGAWDAFNVLVAQLKEPQIWETVLVGHRIEGLTESQIAAWAGQERMRNLGQAVSYAAMYFLRAGVTDRMPSSEFVASLDAMDRPVWKLGGGVNLNYVVRPALEGEPQFVLGPSVPGTILASGIFATTQKTRVKSELVYFAEGYRAIRGGDFRSARAALEESATLYDLSMDSAGYILPYYAYALAKSGDAAAVRQLLDRIPRERQRFDYYLARAVVAGLAGDVENSLKSLRLAIHRRPFTESRPFYTEYQFAELCEWLYESTRNTKYRDLALDWAKKNQTFQPWFAWAYAMEAKLSTNAQARSRAIAMTYYLDKNSERLSAIPKREVEAAVKTFQQDNPFLRAVGSPPTGAT
jgi:thioredoxin-like negative regulator of GroEL